MDTDSATSGWVHTSTAQQVRFGVGVSRRLGSVLRELGIRRVLLVTSAGRANSDEGAAVVEGLGRALTATFAEVLEHAPAPVIQAAAIQARGETIDALVSLGGGSAIDTAKAVGFFLEHESGTPGAGFADRPALPHIAIPTTWSGAASTSRFAMTDPRSRHKTVGGGPTVAPVVAVYDPELIATTDKALAALSGMAALAQSIEVTISAQRTPESEALALAAIGRIWGSLPAAVEGSPEAVTSMTEAAALAGRAAENAELGIVHGLAVLLGGRSGVSHGLASALLLAPALRFNQDAVGDRFEQLGASIGREDLPSAVDELVAELGITERLSDVGVIDEDIEAVARLSQQSPSVRTNPRPTGEADVRALVEDAF